MTEGDDTMSEKTIEGTPATQAPAVASTSDRWRGAGRDVLARAYRGENSGLLFVVLIVTVAVFGFLLRDTTFLSSSNLLSIVETTTAVTVMAVTTVFVICTGEIDLSFATVIPVSAYIAAICLEHHQPVIVAVVAALGFGAAVGLVNGAVTVFFKIPSFVVTLGMLGVLQGYSEAITNSSTLTVTDKAFLNLFGQGHVGTVSVLVLWSVGTALVGALVLSATATGRRVLATGANPNAARFSGIKTGRIKIVVLMFSGMGGALGGLIYVGQFTAATFTLGSSDLLNVLAAVIVGGTALAGGQGSVIGALIGSWLIGLIGNALIILGLSNPQQLMVRGVIIIIAVILSSRPRGRQGGAPRLSQLTRALRPSGRSPAVAAPGVGDSGPPAPDGGSSTG